jgi:hypothetical protein
MSTVAAIAGAAVLVASLAAHPAGQTFQTIQTSQAPQPPTFYKDLLPILQKHCQNCHRPGQIAPFSLLTYESARPWARSMKAKVESRQMPPWFADARHGEFSNDPSLAPGDIDAIVQWADGGALAGNPADAPTPVQWADNGWTVKPDYVIKGVDYPVPAHVA